MSTVYIPSPLRKITNGQAKVQAEGRTVNEVIDRLESAFPGLKARICDESGEVKRFINVFVNGEEIRTLQGLQTAVKENDEVSVIPAMAGG
ncbi:MAG: molybdopterin synthase sulfur carrier subunit [Chloroflexi bacterium RBG_16_57_9]|nr:MAG: molybdopterin synthase sulfur carrier subunit [Chloroflexi bacterium RBG_16_57_9]